MTGLLDAAPVTVTGFVAVAFVLALLAGLRWLAGRAGGRGRG